ncbi:MAG: D-alanyl-D-alanine carboxypeptidase [Oscillospiraceae bacterium]|nr:D-alanyl-D-alanine carboxypeptidase [Oscillospiraceae bacterium]MBQ3952173.1 D-alanyl-D-alanine carboxypeptidase [Oscillospiraceae bacterium]
MKKLLSFIISISLVILPARAADWAEVEDGEDVAEAVFAEGAVPADASELVIPAPSAILIERETGTVLYEKAADRKLEPASVTKVMTILLIAEAIDAGEIGFDDTVIVSARAASMGGSQVYLKEGEEMSVREMLKCIVVSSANDCAVAMAEYLAGSEEGFVIRMNERAAELGMVNTSFKNCTGLYDDPTHLTTARDIALMSREVLSHRWIRDFTTIWTDTIRDGAFGLSNTNKLIRFYPGATGLKTGYTSRAGRCLAASAERDGVEYIAVVLNCATTEDRFESAKTLLSYAFANYTTVKVLPGSVIPPVPVELGKARFVQPVLAEEKSVVVKKSEAGSIESSVELIETAKAPVAEGDILGRLTLTLGGEELASVDLVAAGSVNKLGFFDVFLSLLGKLF